MVQFDEGSENQFRLDKSVEAFREVFEREDTDIDPELHEQFKEWALDFKGRRWSKLKALDVDSQLVLMPFIQILASRTAFDSLGSRGQEYITRVLAEVGMSPPAPKGSDGEHRRFAKRD